jgi:hypothetical protein
MLVLAYIELVGVEAILFLVHVLLLHFIVLLLLSLFLQVEGVLLFVKGWFLLSENVVDEAVGLLGVGLVLLPSVVE